MKTLLPSDPRVLFSCILDAMFCLGRKLYIYTIRWYHNHEMLVIALWIINLFKTKSFILGIHVSLQQEILTEGRDKLPKLWQPRSASKRVYLPFPLRSHSSSCQEGPLELSLLPLHVACHFYLCMWLFTTHNIYWKKERASEYSKIHASINV